MIKARVEGKGARQRLQLEPSQNGTEDSRSTWSSKAARSSGSQLKFLPSFCFMWNFLWVFGAFVLGFSNMLNGYIRDLKTSLEIWGEANTLDKIGQCFLYISVICGVSPLKMKPLWVKSELLTIVSWVISVIEIILMIRYFIWGGGIHRYLINTLCWLFVGSLIYFLFFTQILIIMLLSLSLSYSLSQLMKCSNKQIPCSNEHWCGSIFEHQICMRVTYPLCCCGLFSQ